MWYCVAICEAARRYVVLRGNMWCCAALCGTAWQYVRLRGALWYCVVICDAARRYLVLRGKMWRCAALCDSAWQYVMVRGIVAQCFCSSCCGTLCCHGPWLPGLVRDVHEDAEIHSPPVVLADCGSHRSGWRGWWFHYKEKKMNWSCRVFITLKLYFYETSLLIFIIILRGLTCNSALCWQIL